MAINIRLAMLDANTVRHLYLHKPSMTDSARSPTPISNPMNGAVKLKNTNGAQVSVIKNIVIRFAIMDE